LVRCITWPGITKPKYTQAEAFDSQASEVQRRVSGPERSNTLSTMTSLGLMYYREAKYAQAEALLKQVLEIQRRVLALEHPSTVRSLTNLVIDYQAQGNYPAANALARTALASSPSNPRFLGNVAWILVAAADPGQRRPAKHYHSRAAPFRQSQIMPTSTSCWAR
jgi:Tfp pilus assembly protein PilF